MPVVSNVHQALPAPFRRVEKFKVFTEMSTPMPVSLEIYIPSGVSRRVLWLPGNPPPPGHDFFKPEV